MCSFARQMSSPPTPPTAPAVTEDSKKPDESALRILTGALSVSLKKIEVINRTAAELKERMAAKPCFHAFNREDVVGLSTLAFDSIELALESVHAMMAAKDAILKHSESD